MKILNNVLGGRTRIHVFLTSVLFSILAFSLISVAAVRDADALGPGSGFRMPPFLPNYGDYPLFFRATTNFQELYLGMVLSDLHGTGSEYLHYNAAPVVEWELPDDIRHRVEKEGDPIPEYKKYDELWLTVTRGMTKKHLDEMFRYPSSRLEELNPTVDFQRLKGGEKILVWKRPPYMSESRGKANRGRLIYGEPLRPTDSFKVIYPHRVFGTAHTVATIQSVFDSFRERFPYGNPILIGDISMRGGGFTRPHHSHQSGRDADISYPTIEAPLQYRRFVTTRNRDLDAEKALWLLKRFIDTGYVEYIFVDRRLQRLLVAEAEREGAPPEWIREVFQYHGRGNAIVRHARGHRNHFHVRFRCTKTDSHCFDSIPSRERWLRRGLEIEESEHEAGDISD